MAEYTPNVFAQGGQLAQQAAQSAALRGYTPNAFAGNTAGPQSSNFSAHLSQPVPLDADYISAYQNTPKYNLDLTHLWKSMPTSPIFKPGYTHPQAIEDAVAGVRAQRQLDQQLSQGYYYDDDGNLHPPRTQSGGGND